MGCSDGISEGLTNHKGTSVQREFYIKLSIPEKREIYMISISPITVFLIFNLKKLDPENFTFNR